LAIIGDTASGKSHYIAALLHQMKTELFPASNEFGRLICLTPEVEKQYISDYFEPLLARKQILKPNQPAQSPYANPLIYLLAVSPWEATNLIIYDAAGEDLTHQEHIVRVARFIFNASAFIFIADPARMEPIFVRLPREIQERVLALFQLNKQREAVDVINTTFSLYERYHALPEGLDTASLPVAVMLSKADLLNYITPSAYTFMKPVSYKNGADREDIERPWIKR
jgi:hypothetical protein